VPHQAEFKHHGNVIRTNDSKVFFVSSRANWYPNLGLAFATYEMTFRYPKSLDLVTNGEIVSNVVEGDQRITKRHTSSPSLFAGFNLGEFQGVERTRSDGFKLDVCGSRHLDPALRPKPRPEPTIFDGSNMRGRPTRPEIVPINPPPPDPLGKLNKLAMTV